MSLNSRLANYILYCMSALMLVCTSTSCKQEHTPRPYGYMRLNIPDTAYHTFESAKTPYRFSLSQNANIQFKNIQSASQWFDISYPTLRANIHFTYTTIHNNLGALSDDAQKFVYKHASQADAIPEQGYEDMDKRVFGVLYELQGNTASPMQFVLTDSNHHFLRGAVYFNSTPNPDSIAPAVEYMKTDIIKLFETIEWK